MRGADITDTRVRLRRDPLQNCDSQTRLADTGLAGNEQYLPLSLFCTMPAPEHEIGFFLASNELSEAARVQRLESALHRAFAHNPKDAAGLRQALELETTKVAVLEEITH